MDVNGLSLPGVEWVQTTLAPGVTAIWRIDTEAVKLVVSRHPARTVGRVFELLLWHPALLENPRIDPAIPLERGEMAMLRQLRHCLDLDGTNPFPGQPHRRPLRRKT